MFFKVTIYISVVMIGHVFSVSPDVLNRCPQPTPKVPVPPAFYYADPNDSRYFFTCAFGVPYRMPCPHGTRFNDVIWTCLPEANQLGICSHCSVVSPDVPKRCPQPTPEVPVPPAFYYADPNDSRYFFTCAFGVPYRMPCPHGTRFNDVIWTCLPEANQLGICSPDNTKVPDCSKGVTLIGHPTICQRYYNCSDTTPRESTSFLKAFEMECPYPDLFDITLRKCVPFKEAYCGPCRIPGVEPCSYVNNLCGSPHCQPCSDRFPTCIGLFDGLHEHPDRLWTPYYIQCDTQRTFNVTMCPPHPAGGPGIFSPVSKTCVSILEVPRETGNGQ